MSANPEDLYDDDDIEVEAPNPNLNETKKLQRLLAKAEKLQAEADAKASRLEQELLVSRAGLELSPVQMAALQAVHQGEWDVDALKATATDLGFVKAAPEPSTPEPDLAGYQRLQNAAAGGSEAPGVDWAAAIANAQTEDEVLTIMEKLGRSTPRTSQ